MAETTIAWTATPKPDGSLSQGYTYNHWIGCTKVSVGCVNCYAERENNRFKWNKNGWGRGAERKQTSEKYHQKLRQWALDAVKHSEVRRVFCFSLSDVFDSEVPQAWREEFYNLLEEVWEINDKGGFPNSGLEIMLLTKRVNNIKDMFPEKWIAKPPRFIRMGITIENQDTADKRMFTFLNLWSGKNFISIEPMLGRIDLDGVSIPNQRDLTFNAFTGEMNFNSSRSMSKVSKMDWVITGGESGPNARPTCPTWVNHVKIFCDLYGTPFFHKQWGEWVQYDPYDPVHQGVIDTLKVLNGIEMVMAGRQNTGHLLNGKEYFQFPSI